MIIQKKMVRIITGSPYRAHTEPLFYANRILSIYDLNVNIVGAFMYKCLFEPVTDVFDNYFCTNRDIHGRETRCFVCSVWKIRCTEIKYKDTWFWPLEYIATLYT